LRSAVFLDAAGLVAGFETAALALFGAAGFRVVAFLIDLVGIAVLKKLIHGSRALG
jgi:hypothetical protein